MKVLLLSQSDIKGGAAKVAFELARGLQEAGHTVDMYVTTPSSDAPFVQKLPEVADKKGTLSQRIIHRLGLNNLYLNSALPFNLGSKFFEAYDIIHLHDLPYSLNFASLAWLSRIRPTVWTLHTMNAFTGGCLYAYTCDRWQRSCGNCPEFGKFPLHWLHRDGSKLQNRIKRWVYKFSNLYPVTVSQWLYDQADQSMLNRFPLTCILNPVDHSIFRPISKDVAKAKLNIPPNKKTILFALAANTMDKRKGVETIVKALPLLKTKNIFLIPTAITTLTEEFKKVFEQFDSLPPKHITDVELLATYYNAADLLWHPTLADTSSLVSLEALACGTPVIASKVGGVQEIVLDDFNGYQIPPSDPVALAEKTDVYFSNADIQKRFSEAGLKLTQETFNTECFISKHINLYKKILGKSS